MSCPAKSVEVSNNCSKSCLRGISPLIFVAFAWTPCKEIAPTSVRLIISDLASAKTSDSYQYQPNKFWHYFHNHSDYNAQTFVLMMTKVQAQ